MTLSFPLFVLPKVAMTNVFQKNIGDTFFFASASSTTKKDSSASAESFAALESIIRFLKQELWSFYSFYLPKKFSAVLTAWVTLVSRCLLSKGSDNSFSHRSCTIIWWIILIMVETMLSQNFSSAAKNGMVACIKEF